MLISEYFDRVGKLISDSGIVVNKQIDFTEFASDENRIGIDSETRHGKPVVKGTML